MESKNAEEPTFHRSQHRPVLALSYDLIKTYKYINKVYHRKKADKGLPPSGAPRTGALNNGYDDENYDYIFQVRFMSPYTGLRHSKRVVHSSHKTCGERL